MAEDNIASVKTVKEYKIKWLAPLLAFLFMAWVMLLHVSPDFYHTFPFPFSLSVWRLGAIIFLLVLLVAELVAYASVGRSHITEEEILSASKKEVAQVEYPAKIFGVIYADTYIPLEDDEELKLRTMLARACSLCEKEEECWEKHSGILAREDFNSNLECVKGLRELGT